MTDLDATQLDAVKELLNVGVSQAATALSEMIDDQILLSVPYVELVPRAQAPAKLGQQPDRPLAAVAQSFEGAFWGEALLIFPQDESLELVRSLLREDVPLARLTELEREALCEIGNVILNSCLSTMANMLSCTLDCSLPHYLAGTAHSILGGPATGELPGQAPDQPTGHEEEPTATRPEEVVLFLQVDFLVKEKNIRGYLTFVFDVNAINAFRNQVDCFVSTVSAAVEEAHG